MKGLEGVSDSDFHGWTVPRYGADAKESRGAGVANLAVRRPRNIYMWGIKTEQTQFKALFEGKKFAVTHTFMKHAEARLGATVHTARSDGLFSDRRAPSSVHAERRRRRALDIHVDHCLHR